MILLASHYEEGVTVRARPPHPYDTRWRTIGTVLLREDARHGFYDGAADQGAVSMEIDSAWVVREWPARFHAGPAPMTREPDSEWDEDYGAALAAARYERGLEAVAERRGWA